MSNTPKSVASGSGLTLPTRTEAHARELRALKQAALAAKAAYFGHSVADEGSDIDTQIAFDIEEDRLQKAYRSAQNAYEAALERAMAS